MGGGYRICSACSSRPSLSQSRQIPSTQYILDFSSQLTRNYKHSHPSQRILHGCRVSLPKFSDNIGIEHFRGRMLYIHHLYINTLSLYGCGFKDKVADNVLHVLLSRLLSVFALHGVNLRTRSTSKKVPTKHPNRTNDRRI